MDAFVNKFERRQEANWYDLSRDPKLGDAVIDQSLPGPINLIVAAGQCTTCALHAIDYDRLAKVAPLKPIVVFQSRWEDIRKSIHQSNKWTVMADPEFKIATKMNSLVLAPRLAYVDGNGFLLRIQNPKEDIYEFASAGK